MTLSAAEIDKPKYEYVKEEDIWYRVALSERREERERSKDKDRKHLRVLVRT